MMLQAAFTLLLAVILAFFYWRRAVRKPDKFPPGPPVYPLVGSTLSMQPSKVKHPSLFTAMIHLEKRYGPILGLYLGSLPCVILTDYQDIKKVLSLEETSHRPGQAPSHKFRPGWECPYEMDGEINRDRTAGVIGSNVSLKSIHSFLIGSCVCLDDFRNSSQLMPAWHGFR